MRNRSAIARTILFIYCENGERARHNWRERNWITYLLFVIFLPFLWIEENKEIDNYSRIMSTFWKNLHIYLFILCNLYIYVFFLLANWLITFLFIFILLIFVECFCIAVLFNNYNIDWNILIYFLISLPFSYWLNKSIA